MNLRALIFILAILVANAAIAEEFVGIPAITDGDTVVIGETKIRLLDMDAPESDQSCLDKKGAPRKAAPEVSRLSDISRRMI